MAGYVVRFTMGSGEYAATCETEPFDDRGDAEMFASQYCRGSGVEIEEVEG